MLKVEVLVDEVGVTGVVAPQVVGVEVVVDVDESGVVDWTKEEQANEILDEELEHCSATSERVGP